MRGALVLAVLVAACSAPATAPVGSPPSTYTFAMLSLDGLRALDSNGKVVGTIVDLPTDSAGASSLQPAPGGGLVFALARNNAKGFGSDILAVGLDGQNLHTILEHEGANVFYASPVLDRNGQLFVHRRQPQLEGGVVKGVLDEILRVDLKTGARSVLVRDGADLALSPDGTYLAYIHLVNGSPDSLWRVNVDGTAARALLTTRDRWSYQQTPRFSPDGRNIAISAAQRTTSASGGGRLAHLNIPSDIVLIDAGGRSARQVAKTSDDTTPGWSPDGRQIAYVALGALNVVDIASGTVRELARGDNFSFGEIVWVRP